jgi:hypothetical protein
MHKKMFHLVVLKLTSAQRFCDGIAAAGPLRYSLKAFLISIAPVEDRLNDLRLTLVLVRREPLIRKVH